MFIFFYLFINLVFAGSNEELVETKTKQMYNFLDMLRSASGDNSGRSSTSHSDWKVSYKRFCFLHLSIAYLDHTRLI